MTRRIRASLLLILCLTGCTRRNPRTSNCEWFSEPASTLDLGKASDRQHLSDDVLIAEDLAIRYADALRGPRSGHFEGLDEYARTRHQCMVTLFTAIQKNHSVTPPQILEALKHRRMSLDLAVILPFAMLYGFAASFVARNIWRRFPPDEGWIAGAVATLLVSAVVSLVGVLLGEFWSVTAESLITGTGHLSYRQDRIPWVQHRDVFFAAGVVLFWLIAALRYRKSTS